MSRRQLAQTLLAAVVGSAVTVAVLAAAREGDPAVAGDGGRLASAAGLGAGLAATSVFERAAPGVVAVRARSVQPIASPFGVADTPTGGVSTGSGFVLDEEGRVVTNAHVVSGVADVQVTFPDLRTVPARVLGKDEETDLAVLEVDPEGVDLEPLELGDSDAVRPGDPALALGNPSGEPVAGTGRVSDARQQVATDSGAVVEDVIRTDAVILPGTSGGPLLDADGRVIGVTSRVAAGGGTVGLAVPVNTAKEVLAALREGHKVIRPYLGVRGRSAPAGGVLVEDVHAGGPAEAAGLRAGDVVEAVDGEAVTVLDDMLDEIAGREPGDGVTLRVLRGGARSEVRVTLGERPTTLPAG